ncbi:YibE/F family protein [Fructilactobacillus florum]|uniref:YibE/F family protein n=1 Tax=Fructilactobacillus florum TaxID=640331 RepID=UPI000ADE8605|nr:YibE/F family protein [Fructilactobacillus florum]
MTTIMALILILFASMLLAGGRQGFVSFLGLIFNFGIVFISVVLIAMGFPYLIVTLINAVIILVVSIYFGNEQGRNADVAFITALLVVGLLVILIIPVQHWLRCKDLELKIPKILRGSRSNWEFGSWMFLVR